MCTCTLRLRTVPAAMCCLLALLLLLAFPAHAADYGELVQFTELANTFFDMSDWTSVNGVTAQITQHSDLTNGAYTMQGRSTAFTETGRVATASVLVDNISVSNGYFVINRYFPQGSSVTLSRIHGTVAANTPLLDASAFSFVSIVITLRNCNVQWPAVETVMNTQVLVHTPPLLTTTSALFVLNSAATSASAVVALPGVRSGNGLVVDTHSLIAIDYTNCSGCANGLLHTQEAMLVARSGSLLRVSRSIITDVPTGTALIDLATSTNGVVLFANSLLLVENVTLPLCSVFRAGTVTTEQRSSAVLRYVTANSLGASLDAGASYKLLTLSQNAGAALSSAVPIAVSECAAACVLPATLDASCSCVCTAQAEEQRYMNLCTYVRDAALQLYPDTCAAGCASCTSAAAGSCTVCREGYTLSGGVCYQRPVGCPVNCAQCTATGVCQECASGYALSTTKACVACRASNCKTCTASVDTCSACRDGYSMIGGTCQQSCLVERCSSCLPSNNARCLTCENGYETNRAGTCDKSGNASSELVRFSLLAFASIFFAVYVAW